MRSRLRTANRRLLASMADDQVLKTLDCLHDALEDWSYLVDNRNFTGDQRQVKEVYDLMDEAYRGVSSLMKRHRLGRRLS